MGNSLGVQWLGLRSITAESPGSIPGWGTKIPQAVWLGQKNKKEKKNLWERSGGRDKLVVWD